MSSDQGGLNQPLIAQKGVAEGQGATIIRLANLDPLDYERLRKEEADRLGVRVAELDKVVQRSRKQSQDSNSSILCSDVAPWEQAVCARVLFDDIFQTIKSFIVCSDETAIAATLWAAFTWFIDNVQVAPLAIITSPEKRCGKTQFLDVLNRLCHRPLIGSNISSAAVYRVIERESPTLLIDEADSFLKENEALRGVINSGHTRQSSYVIRTVGDDFEPRRFSTWSAKAIAGIGHLSGTLMDRGIVLELRRKLKTEKVKRLRHADPEDFRKLASMLARLAIDSAQAVQSARPELPDQLHDRAQDNWEPLLTLADLAGGDWPNKSRSAALVLSGVQHEPLSMRIQLLADIYESFQEGGWDRISSLGLIKALAVDESKPWSTYDDGRLMTPRQLSNLLKPYGVQSKDIKIEGVNLKGFTLDQFQDTFKRFVDALPLPSVIDQIPATHEEFGGSLGSGSSQVAKESRDLERGPDGEVA